MAVVPAMTNLHNFYRAQDLTGPIDDRIMKLLRLSPRMIDYIEQADRNLGGRYVVGTNFRWSWTREACEARTIVEWHARFGWVLSSFGERVRQRLIDDGRIVANFWETQR